MSLHNYRIHRIATTVIISDLAVDSMERNDLLFEKSSCLDCNYQTTIIRSTEPTSLQPTVERLSGTFVSY